MKLNTETFRLTDSGSLGTKALLVGAAGLVLSAVGYVMNAEQFFHSYLVAFAFWTSIGLGAMFFTLIHHLVGATWSIVLRRIAEALMVTLPVMIVFFVPLIFGFHHLYEWSRPEVMSEDSLLKEKAGYLNTNFFIIRTVVYFLIWFVVGRILYKFSVKQDSGDHSSDDNMRRFSAPGMILFALSLTYAAYDWIMSLQPHWYSTIFGVWYFAGSFLAVLSFLVIFGLYLRKKEILAESITVEHYHDLGKFLFAFTIFWSYISFSQFFLIWYANMPEETIFYLRRWEGSWMYVSLFQIAGHLMIPFAVLIPRVTKRNFTALKIIALWILFCHWVDLYWNIMPNYSKTGIELSWIDAATMLGIGGIFVWFFWKRYTAEALIAAKDPNFEASLHFANP
jgi:hypothetical protein